MAGSDKGLYFYCEELLEIIGEPMKDTIRLRDKSIVDLTCFKLGVVHYQFQRNMGESF